MDISPNLSVDNLLQAFVEDELLPGTGVSTASFWSSLEALLADFMPRNQALLARRDELQAQVDAWWKARKGQSVSIAEQTEFLKEIGYLLPEPAAFQIDTVNVDPEIARIAGPQLVVPVSNGRYALNAANARWGSLYDALYGTDAIPGERKPGYDVERGAAVIGYARQVLDEIAPLTGGSHADAHLLGQQQLFLGHSGPPRHFYLSMFRQMSKKISCMLIITCGPNVRTMCKNFLVKRPTKKFFLLLLSRF
jgi:malate synthase